MKKTTQNNGITLVALIITIIILLILAMVTINILINQGIIGHANNAVRGYEVAEEKELIGLGYQNYKMDKLNNSDAELTVDGATVVKDDDVNGWYITFTKTKHNYSLADNGTVEETGERWVKDGDTFKLGDATVKVGDYVGYDHTKDANGNAVAIQSYTSYSEENASADKNNGRTSGYTSNQTFNVNNYTGGWRVLGVKSGKVQLISASSVGSLYLEGKEGYRDSEKELNAICAIYGQGKRIAEARSITVEDVNDITGYNPNKTGNGKKFSEGSIAEYGNNVTYYWKGDTSPYYVGANGKTGSIGGHSDGFNWYEGGSLHHSDVSTTATNTDTGREKITVLKSTYYYYNPTTLTDNNSEEIKGLSTDSENYEVLFGQSYWLSSRCVFCPFYSPGFYVRYVNGGNVSTARCFSADDTSGAPKNSGIRPIVTLSLDAQIKMDANHDGSSKDKAFILQ